MAPSRRRLLAAVALALAAGVGVVAIRAGTTRAPPAAPATPAAAPPAPPVPLAPAPPPPAAPELQVLSLSGAVDAGDAQGTWRPLAVGEVLRTDGQVRTGAGASAELSTGAANRLVVGERSQLAVRELSTAVHGFRLTRGRLSVDYQPDGDRVVRVEEASGGAVAEARAARFHVAANGLAFAVATQVGTVSLTAAGASVSVAEGEASLAAAGAPPTAPRPIPTEVLLKVAEASRLGPAGRCLDTTGRTDPGALVTVDGEPVEVDAGGRFAIHARWRGGGRGVEVRVVVPDGRVSTRTLPCSAGPEAHIRDLRVRWKRAEP